MTVAIIPARGGSKRIPGKNRRDFCGAPMLSYPIKAALASGCIDRVIVSTDDDAIAEVARHFGAEVPFMRPKDLSDDYTGTTAVIRHALKWLKSHGELPEYACCLYATTPLLQPQDLCQALLLLKKSTRHFVFSAARYSFPIQRALLQTEDGSVAPYDPASIGKRSQDLPETFHDAGQFYWGRSNSWLSGEHRMFSESASMYLLPDHRVQDIDTPADWRRAELLYQLLHNDSDHEDLHPHR
ncbi:pseudaminic acid cytidylyltransferase [Alkalimonas sp.]|uniref:pseudaminic acid cytidylyltransferase n=1 Tax=Alkalimonas sp. TaxID=1872453 RepID=UPI00263BC81D|nr:pseudaminic acid cytidylyltransferase [Alkalimonas sp.]MCC5827203.1 pseudaminic acid cytidylyltransferase [Alkalimonas sp.]